MLASVSACLFISALFLTFSSVFALHPMQQRFHKNGNVAILFLHGMIIHDMTDVAIHYRCSDNLFGGMGLLSFGTLLKLIPPEANTIYIFTEYGNRLTGTPLAKAATHILQRLYSILSAAYPRAIVVIKRGGNEATAVAQLTLARKLTICSPSTFCVWSGKRIHSLLSACASISL